jgi:hypothetical protein
MTRTIGFILCALLAVQMVAADTAFVRSSTLTKLAARVKAKAKLVAPTVLGSGETAESHGVEPSYSFIAESASVSKKQKKETPKTMEPAAKGTPSGIKRVPHGKWVAKTEAPHKATKTVAVKTVQIATAEQAKAAEAKVEQTVTAAKSEEKNLASALATVKAEEKKDDPNAAAAGAAAPAAAGAQAEAVNAAEQEVGKEEEAVAEAENKVEAEAAAVSDAVKDEQAVKAEVEGLEEKTEEAAPAGVEPADVTVGPKFIPAGETRSVLVVGNSAANAEKYNAVDASPKLLTDPAELKSIDESQEKTSEDITAIAQKVDEISKGPLVPAPGGEITA